MLRARKQGGEWSAEEREQEGASSYQQGRLGAKFFVATAELEDKQLKILGWKGRKAA